MKILLILVFSLSSFFVYGKNIFDCKKIIDNDKRLACYDSLTDESTSSNAIIIPSIEKIIEERTPTVDADEPFFGCIYFIEYGDEDLLTQKRELSSIRIGNSKGYATLFVDDFDGLFMGDLEVPKIGDCFAFTTKRGLIRMSEGQYLGNAKIYHGEYKIDETVVEIEFKNEITVNKYFEQGVSYGSKRIKLTGEVEKISSDNNLIWIDLIDDNGNLVTAQYWSRFWINNESIINRIRSIKIGDTITVDGNFTMEMGGTFAMFEVRKILE